MRMRCIWITRWPVSTMLGAAIAVAVPAMAWAQHASVSGRVVAANSVEPIVDARVMVAGTSMATNTNGEGRFTLRDVPVGEIDIRVIRVGYEQQKKAIAVSAGQDATLDFALAQAVVRLPDVVTTATGEQRRVELGNSVSTLGDVTQKVETTPINTMADLLVAKAPGVVVLPGAMTGAAPVVRIRGLGSLATTGSGVTNNPIYVIDGVRMGSGAISFGTGGTQSSFVNDIDPNEIEDIEIVKGPSAATLYGTDAANGVIVITTKKGRAGATRWSWYGEGGGVDERNKYPTDYASWGHNATTNALQRCTLVTERGAMELGGAVQRRAPLVRHLLPAQ